MSLRTSAAAAVLSGLIAVGASLGAGTAAADEPPQYGPEWSNEQYGPEWDNEQYGPEWDNEQYGPEWNNDQYGPEWG